MREKVFGPLGDSITEGHIVGGGGGGGGDLRRSRGRRSRARESRRGGGVREASEGRKARPHCEVIDRRVFRQ